VTPGGEVSLAFGGCVDTGRRVAALSRMAISSGGNLITVMWLLRSAAVVAAAQLTACTTSGIDSPHTIFADPGQYQFYTCEQMEAERKSLITRQQDLKALTDKAEQGTGGSVVGLLAYRSDAVNVSEQLQVLRATAVGKNCSLSENWGSSDAIR
jgi:hypothetical protein